MATAEELTTQRDRLVERFALLQSELGGLFYEMAIRDHVRMDVLIARAAALQAVDGELSQVEQLLGAGRSVSNPTTPPAASGTDAPPAGSSSGSTPPASANSL